MKIKPLIRSIYALAAAALAAAGLAACSADEPEQPADGQPEIVTPRLHISVADMEMEAETRAASPMSPDIEKYVKRIAIFEFDNEGMHINGPNTYHFVDFTKGTIDGLPGPKGSIVSEPIPDGIVEATLDGLTFESYEDGMICVVANVTEEDVDNLYRDYKEEDQTEGRLIYDRFKYWSLKFNYEDDDQLREYDYFESNSGHIKEMYMFGYWKGKIEAATVNATPIDLGRLASRLDITIVNETGRDIDKRFGYHFDNVCDSAYFFPMKMSMSPKRGAGKSRTVICTGVNDPLQDLKIEPGVVVPETFAQGDSHTRYFYVAAHSAKNYDEATKLHLFWNSRINNCPKQDEGGWEGWIPMCNLRPDIAPDVTNGYSLSRNTRYHFTIRVRSAATKARSAAPAAPGEYIIYLPD